MHARPAHATAHSGRRWNRMTAMHQEVRDLEGEYTRAVQSQHGLDRGESLHQDDRLDGLVRLYSQLCVEKEELRRENPQLTLLVKEHTQFHRKTQRFVETEHASSSLQRKVRRQQFPPPLSSCGPGGPFQVWNRVDGTPSLLASQEIWNAVACVAWDGVPRIRHKSKVPRVSKCSLGLLSLLPACLLSQDGEPSLGSLELEPMTAQDCHEVSCTAYLEICAFLKTHSYLTTGTPLFGWHDRREEHSDHIKFTLKKRFAGATPTEMSTRAWRVTSSPQELRSLYSPTLRLAFKALQTVDDNNVVMYRLISSADGAKRVQSLFLISRFQVDDGFIILFRSVDRHRLRKAPVDREGGELQVANAARGLTEAEWLEVFSWTLFEHARDDEQGGACLLSYGGITHSTEAASSRVWMMEVLLLALRWEAKVVGPPFMLRQ
ncbi:hypothetical protein BBJ28_00014461 [Nothophytophthora sp. Chile5]|nr:hypothetical protein BBJ28_00014461 [Nothophytophthora sp. Chile5]